jgi:hypothetical protein
MGWETESGQTIWVPTKHQSDRRQATRFDLDMRLVVRPTSNRSRLIPARIVDLSCGGIRAAIAADLENGETLELEFGLRHTTATVRLEGMVRWRDGYQYGLEFVFVTAADRERMSQAFAALACSGE